MQCEACSPSNEPVCHMAESGIHMLWGSRLPWLQLLEKGLFDSPHMALSFSHNLDFLVHSKQLT